MFDTKVGHVHWMWPCLDVTKTCVRQSFENHIRSKNCLTVVLKSAVIARGKLPMHD